jgi:hypothetical protein
VLQFTALIAHATLSQLPSMGRGTGTQSPSRITLTIPASLILGLGVAPADIHNNPHYSQSTTGMPKTPAKVIRHGSSTCL